MQIAAVNAKSQSLSDAALSGFLVTGRLSKVSRCSVIDRNGLFANLDASRILVVLTKVFLAVGRVQRAAPSGLQQQAIDDGLGKPHFLNGGLG